MLVVARSYPQFILPLSRQSSEGQEGEKAYEFYMLQWDTYDPPPSPSASTDPFVGKAGEKAEAPSTGAPSSSSASSLPRTATAIFTPLGEYKLRQAFATPHLALTFYPDLSDTHNLVLLRGELTPRTSAPDQYLLSQQDAQLLVMGLQRFYLWSTAEGSGSEHATLLRTFHERPEEFKWEELVKLGDMMA